MSLRRLSVLHSTFLAAGTLVSSAAAQSVIVPDSTVRTVASFSHATGDLEAAGFMDLDDGALPTLRSYQGTLVGTELWFTDDVLGRITRWNRFGTVQLGAIDLPGQRLRGIEFAFGKVWVAAGNPSGSVQDYLVELTPAGALVAMHPMPGLINGVVAFGNELLVADADSDDILLVDPATGAVSGVFHASNGVSGIDSPQQLQVLPNGHVLAASILPPVGFFEYDAQGNQIHYVDTSAFPLGGGALGVHRLADGRTLVSIADSVLRYDPVANQLELLIDSLVPYFFTLVPSIPLGVPECGPAVLNSTGRPATIQAVGSVHLSDSAVRLVAQDLPNASNGYFLASLNAGFVPNAGNSQGTLCLGGTIGRFNQQIQFSANDGFFSITVNPNAIPQPNGAVPLLAGQTWRFQCWYRDANPNSTSNFTNATAVTFQ
jgi:hypothetical protein